MEMIDQEIMRLKRRMDELAKIAIPDLEHKSQMLFAQIMPLPKDSPERERLEAEYEILSKELRLRSDEMIKKRQEIQYLEQQKKSR